MNTETRAGMSPAHRVQHVHGHRHYVHTTPRSPVDTEKKQTSRRGHKRQHHQKEHKKWKQQRNDHSPVDDMLPSFDVTPEEPPSPRTLGPDNFARTDVPASQTSEHFHEQMKSPTLLSPDWQNFMAPNHRTHSDSRPVPTEPQKQGGKGQRSLSPEIPPWLFETQVFAPWFDDYLPWADDYSPAVIEEVEEGNRRNSGLIICFGAMLTSLAGVFLVFNILLFLRPKAASSVVVNGTTDDYGYYDFGDSAALNESTTTKRATDGPQGWSEWTSVECSVSCGLGTITRRRTCSGPDCKQPEETEFTECYQGACTCSFYVSNHLNIFRVNESGSTDMVYTTTAKAVALDLAYDPLTQGLFWSNNLKQVVMNEKVVTTGSYNLGGLIVDSKEQLIFVAAKNRGILSVSFNGEDQKFVQKDPALICETLITLEMDKTLYWANNKRSQVESINYDGSSYKILYKIPTSYGPVAGMTVDIATKTLYWIHRKGAKIFSLPHDGSSSPQQVFSGSNRFVGEDLVICKEHLFYVDPKSGGGGIFQIGLDGKNRQQFSKSAIIKCKSLYIDN